MKYKALLTGSQQSAIDDFFTHMDENFECITTSVRLQDIIRHIRIFKPDLFIFCARDESYELMSHMHEVKKQCRDYDVAFAVLGDEEECNNFIKASADAADIVLIKPLTNKMIMNAIDDYFIEREEERRREAERIKELERQQSRKHILIVDDDPNMLKLLKAELEDEYDIATAINGSLALRFLTKKKTDLILLDYEMSGQDGAQVLSILRGSESTRDIPVVFLTGVTDTDKIKKVLALKPQGYLLKPVDRSKLTAIISQVFGANEE